MEKNYIGIDLGGTKTAAIIATQKSGSLEFIAKESFPTKGTPSEILQRLSSIILPWIRDYGASGIGISCGGPLNSADGIILSPPNLPLWDNIHVTEYFSEKTGLKAKLCNDANACALAEWKYGAGQGSKNMIFLTFGTGFGAGLILDGKLYEGTNGMAGEIGHVRMTNSGVIGYGKIGSMESYCSGGGIARLGKLYIDREIKKGNDVPLLRAANGKDVTAKDIAALAKSGDKLSQKIYKKSGEMLGKGLSLLIDLFNPERIVIGGVYMRSGELMEKEMRKQLKQETLSENLSVCEILPAALGESVGDYSAVAVISEE